MNTQQASAYLTRRAEELSAAARHVGNPILVVIANAQSVLLRQLAKDLAGLEPPEEHREELQDISTDLSLRPLEEQRVSAELLRYLLGER